MKEDWCRGSVLDEIVQVQGRHDQSAHRFEEFD